MASSAVDNMGHFVRRVVSDDAIENYGGSVIFVFRFVVLFSFALNLQLSSRSWESNLCLKQIGTLQGSKLNESFIFFLSLAPEVFDGNKWCFCVWEITRQCSLMVKNLEIKPSFFYCVFSNGILIIFRLLCHKFNLEHWEVMG